MKEWFTSTELAGLPGMSKYATNVTRKAKNMGWVYRQQKGIKGVSYEYHISSLPIETLQHLGINKLDKLSEFVEHSYSGNTIDIALYELNGKLWSNARIQTRLTLPKDSLGKERAEHCTERLVALFVPDTTMEPTLQKGEVLIASKVESDENIDNGVYVIETPLGITVRRLKPYLLGSKIRVCCDSEKFDDEYLSLVEFQQSVKVIAKSIFVLMKPIV